MTLDWRPYKVGGLALALGTSLTSGAPVSAQAYSAPARECRFDSRDVQGDAREIVEPQSAGVLSKTSFDYTGGREGEPYSGANFGGRRLGYGNRDEANLDLRFTLAGMVLDAGYRYFEPGNYYTGSKSTGSVGDRIIGVFGANNDRKLSGGVSFCDAPGKRTQDAVEVYNRLGAQLLGDRFSARSGPASTKLMWRDTRSIERW